MPIIKVKVIKSFFLNFKYKQDKINKNKLILILLLLLLKKMLA